MRRDLTGAIDLWIDVGLPDEREIRKAAGRAARVKVYTYGRGATLWWRDNEAALSRLSNVDILFVEASAELGAWADRNMKLSCTVQDGDAYFSRGDSVIHIPRRTFPGA